MLPSTERPSSLVSSDSGSSHEIFLKFSTSSQRGVAMFLPGKRGIGVKTHSAHITPRPTPPAINRSGSRRE
jgi:hypothetical protein